MKKPHISSGGVIYRILPKNKIEVLLIHQRISHKWHLPKGTHEGKESLEETALRETEEEKDVVEMAEKAIKEKI